MLFTKFVALCVPLIAIVFAARTSCFVPVHNLPLETSSALAKTHRLPARIILFGLQLPILRLSSDTEFNNNLGPAERVQRSLDRDAGTGRADIVRAKVSQLLELRRRGLKYDGTPMSAEEKAVDAAKLMEKMMRDAEKFLGS
jgi:hypothetical protein